MLKRKTAMKRTGISRTPKSPMAKAKAETWRLTSLYVRYRDALKTTGSLETCLCVTCGREKPTKAKGGVQAGHFIPGRHNGILYDTRGIHGQCAYCNDHLKGNWIPYLEYMRIEYGQDVVDELIARDKTVVSWSIRELEVLQDELKIKIEALGASWKK